MRKKGRSSLKLNRPDGRQYPTALPGGAPPDPSVMQFYYFSKDLPICQHEFGYFTGNLLFFVL